MEDSVPTAELVDDYVEPKVSTVRTFGILNIVFSLMIGCLSLYALGMAVMMPYIVAGMEKANDDMQKQQQERQDKRIAELDKLIADAETDAEKESLLAEKDLVASTEPVEMPNMLAAMNDPKMIAYSITDGSTGLLLNALLLCSGIGLLSQKEWARKLALWVAGLKIIRQIILQTVNIIVIVPIQVEMAKQMFDQMQPNGAGAPPFNMASFQGVMYASMAVLTLVVSCIYPALTLWFLSRPGVKVVCAPGFEESAED